VPTDPLRRDGKDLDLPWQQASVSTNTGSGVAGVTAFQACDCNLAPGSYTYRITPPAPGTRYGQDAYELTVVITDPPPQPQGPAPIPEGDVAPWDEPEDPWPKGVDCAAWCANPPVPEAEPVADVPAPGDVATADVPSTDVALPDDSINPLPDTGGKGCVAAAAGSAGAGLPVAATLVMLVLARLRRRQYTSCIGDAR
jgi:hypothetical protein